MKIILTSFNKHLRSGAINVKDNIGLYYEVPIYKDTLCEWADDSFADGGLKTAKFERTGETEYIGENEYAYIYKLVD